MVYSEVWRTWNGANRPYTSCSRYVKIRPKKWDENKTKAIYGRLVVFPLAILTVREDTDLCHRSQENRVLLVFILQHKLDVTYLCIDVLILYSDRIKLYVVMCKTEMIQLQLQQTIPPAGYYAALCILLMILSSNLSCVYVARCGVIIFRRFMHSDKRFSSNKDCTSCATSLSSVSSLSTE